MCLVQLILIPFIFLQVDLNNNPRLRVWKSPECKNSIYLASPHSLDVGVRSQDSCSHSRIRSDDHYIKLPDSAENFLQNDALERSVGTTRFIQSTSGQSWDEFEDQTSETSEDLCKEVRCIETEESCADKWSEFNRSSPEGNTEISESVLAGNGHRTDQEFVSPPLKEDRASSYIPAIIPPPEWPLTNYMSSFQCLKLSKSRSCKASLMTNPYSPWIENKNTPPNAFENDVTARPEDIRRKLSKLNYIANVEKLSRNGVQSSVGSAAAVELEADLGKTSIDGNITCINTSIAVMEEKAGLQQEKQAADSPVSFISLFSFT